MAVDGSEESFKAVQYAVDLAKEEDDKETELIALVVNETPPFLSIVEPSALEKWREHIKLEAETFFDRISTYKCDIDSHVQLRTEMIDSAKSIYAAIVDYAEKENADLIVLGTRGRTGFKKILLGSVALGVVTHATCPVLMVK